MPAIPSGTTYRTVLLAGTTAAARPQLNGTVLSDSSVTYQNWLDVQERVVRSRQTGLLDFYWRLTQAPGSTVYPQALTFYASFAHGNAVISWADFRPDGLGTNAPVSAIINQGQVGTTTVGFNFNTGNLANGGSRFFFISTAKANWTPNHALIFMSPGHGQSGSQYIGGPGPA